LAKQASVAASASLSLPLVNPGLANADPTRPTNSIALNKGFIGDPYIDVGGEALRCRSIKYSACAHSQF
jgi:hypothetical protein